MVHERKKKKITNKYFLLTPFHCIVHHAAHRQAAHKRNDI